MTYIAKLCTYGNDRLIIEVTGGKRPGRTVVSNTAQSVRQALSTYDRRDLKVIPLSGVRKTIRQLALEKDLGRVVDLTA